MTITDKHAKELLGIAKATAAKCGSPDDVDDVAQSAFVKLLELEDAGRVANRFVAFAMIEVIAHQTAINLYNKNKRRKDIEQSHGREINRHLTGQSAEHLSAQPDDIIMSEEIRERLINLSPLVYATAHMHYIDGMSVARLTMEFACSEDVIYKRLQRARDAITGEQ